MKYMDPISKIILKMFYSLFISQFFPRFKIIFFFTFNKQMFRCFHLLSYFRMCLFSFVFLYFFFVANKIHIILVCDIVCIR